jgi:hypothetical protein
MPITNFRKGFMGGLSVRGMPLLQTYSGNVYWVDNGPTSAKGGSVQGADGNAGTLHRPFASLAGALNQCQQGNGDIIFIKPGHREEVTDAATTTQPTGASGTSLNLNVADVAIIGLGAGSARPTFTFSTAATANVPVQARGMSIQNCRFIANFADIASLFTGAAVSSATSTIAAGTGGNVGFGVMTAGTTTGTWYPGMAVMGSTVKKGTYVISQLTGTTGGAGTYLVYPSQTATSATMTGGQHAFNIEGCVFEDTSSILNALTIFTGAAIANSMDSFRFANNRVSSLGTTAATCAIVNGGVATDAVEIDGNYMVHAILNDSPSVLTHSTGAAKNIQIMRNVGFKPNTSSTGGSFVALAASSTGVAYDNYFWQLDASAGIWIATGSGIGFFNNYSPITGAADKSGLINPAAV